jgi:phage FluMu gp28-like protein
MNGLLQSPLDVLLSYQRRWFFDRARFKAGCWSRQTGKDFSTAAEATAECNFLLDEITGEPVALREKKDAITYMIAAPSERQSIESLGKCRDWSTAWDVTIADLQEDRDAPGTLLKSATITFANGSRIIAVPGRPDTVRGMSANLILTEFAFFDDPDATWKAVLPSIINPLRGGEKKVRIISTPNGKTGQGARFFKIVDENFLNPKPGRKQSWSVHKVTIEDAVAAGLPVDIEELREAMDDPEAFAQECMCEFLDGSSVLLPYDLIALAETPEADLAAPGDYFTPANRKALYCGVDFGRVSDPTVCWTLERLGTQLITREVLVLRNTDTPAQQAILRSRIATAQRTCFDYTGPGIGLGDYLAKDLGKYDPDHHEFGKIELFTFTAGSKRLLFPRLRKAFEAPTTLRIPVDVNVREDLHAMQQVIRNGEYTYSAPRTAEGHSDRCTALALAVRAAGENTTATFPPTPSARKRNASRTAPDRERYSAA